MIARPFSIDELNRVIDSTEALVGEPLGALIESWKRGAISLTPPRHQHRLIELLQRLRYAVNHADDPLAVDAAAVAIAEVDGIVSLFGQFRSDPIWPEFQDALKDARSYLHAVVVLNMVSALRECHPDTRFVASGVPNGSADLRMVVTTDDSMDVEVKTSLDLTNRQAAMSQAEAVRFVRRQLRRPTKHGKRQLSNERPGLLVIGAFEIDADTFEALTKGAEFVLSRQNGRPSLAAIVISRTATESVVEGGRPIVNFGHASRIRSNPNYSGNIRFTGSWDGKWRLRKVDGGTLGRVRPVISAGK